MYKYYVDVQYWYRDDLQPRGHTDQTELNFEKQLSDDI